jgi:hypothetical protein
MPRKSIAENDDILMKAFERAQSFMAEQKAIMDRYKAEGRLECDEMKKEIDALAKKRGYVIRTASDFRRALPASPRHTALAREVAEKLTRRRPR